MEDVTRRGVILFVLLGVIWGIPYLLIKIAVGGLDPAMLLLSRTGLAALVLLPVAAVRGEIGPVLRRWRPLLAYTVAELVVPQLLLGTAEERLPSSTTGLLIAAVPLAGVGIAALLGRPERMSAANWLGIGVGMTGVATLAGFAVSGSDLGATGEVLVVVIGYALGPAILARWMDGLPGTGVTAVALAITAVVCVPLVTLAHGWPARWPAPPVLASVISLAVVCTAAGFTIMAMLVGEVGPVRATAVTYLNPAVALAAGAIVLGEPVTGWSLAGFALILAGCLLVAVRRPSAVRPVRPGPAPPGGQPEPVRDRVQRDRRPEGQPTAGRSAAC
ncbi:MAG TPA: EamA family transporter [Streptosporangiaceae bacterium]|nr:EamA family transporter [Streptosporangiaceae bacterium]